MHGRLLIALLPLFAPGTAPEQRSPAADQVPKRREALAPLFARAQHDPAGVVPLLVAGSAELEGLPPKEAALLGDTLDVFARRVFFGPERLAGMERFGLSLHAIEKGEVLDRIAARHRIGAGLLGYLNEELDETRLRVGQELKVLDLPAGALEIVIEKSSFRLYAWRRLATGTRVLVLCTPVGLGAMDSPTPSGRSTIVKRVLHPEWTHPISHTVFPDGHPENVLGGYWMALDSSAFGRTGIGLHGYTGAPAANWIEKSASNGCVRMLQGDIDRLFHLAVEGTSVELRDGAARSGLVK